MSTKIFTITHKLFTPPQDDTYIPLQVGAASNPSLGYLTDDTGDNISDLNKFYGELTGMYWIWKNYPQGDNIGICHYRRYFIDSQQKILSEANIETLLKEHDIIVSNSVICNTSSYFEDFAEAHNPKILKFVENAIQNVCPEYLHCYKEVFCENTYHYGNLIIMPHHLFNAYASWLFSIFSALEPLLQISFVDQYHQRVFGFISENMITVWARFHKLSLYECPIGITSEKAETKELKLAMSQLFKIHDIETASQMFYEYLSLRPDVRLPLSDLHGEVPIIEQLIYICLEEQKAGLTNTLNYSSDLSKLIELYRTVKEKILHKDSTFISEHHISHYMIAVIIVNMPLNDQEKQEYMQLYTLL